MSTPRGPRLDATILGAASLLAIALGGGAAVSTDPAGTPAHPAVVSGVSVSDLTGVWTSADRAVRLELKVNGQFQRSIKGRAKPARGTYKIDGLHLKLRDDSGLVTAVIVYDDALEMAGHRLHRD